MPNYGNIYTSLTILLVIYILFAATNVFCHCSFKQNHPLGPCMYVHVMRTSSPHHTVQGRLSQKRRWSFVYLPIALSMGIPVHWSYSTLLVICPPGIWQVYTRSHLLYGPIIIRYRYIICYLCAAATCKSLVHC